MLRDVDSDLQSPAINSAQPIFFPFALKTRRDMKDIVARALIYSPLFLLYGVNFVSVSRKFENSQKHKLDILDYSSQKWYRLQNNMQN